MSTLLASAPEIDVSPLRRWLPGPAKRLPAPAACPVCAGVALFYSTGDAYLACLYCGWQRRLLTPDHRFDACWLAVGHPLPGVSWPALLTDLQAQPADPLPPVAALLWRQTGPDSWQGPSRTTPDTTYTITQGPSGHVHCDCPHWGRGCWHRLRCAELGLVDQTSAEGLF